jgi:hypothetical protein
MVMPLISIIIVGTGSMVAWLGHATALTGAVASFTVGPFRPERAV